MKKIIIVAMILMQFMNAKGQTDLNTIQEIEKVCSNYLDGGTNNDSSRFASAFYPDGNMMFMRNDTFRIVPLKTFMTGVKNGGEKQDRKTRIESVSVYGNAAVAKLTCEYPTFYFHDIMQLLKTKEGWKIVNKIFYRENK
jgi:hypothetical protein